jgi:hypothetical protein
MTNDVKTRHIPVRVPCSTPAVVEVVDTVPEAQMLAAVEVRLVHSQVVQAAEGHQVALEIAKGHLVEGLGCKDAAVVVAGTENWNNPGKGHQMLAVLR